MHVHYDISNIISICVVILITAAGLASLALYTWRIYRQDTREFERFQDYKIRNKIMEDVREMMSEFPSKKEMNRLRRRIQGYRTCHNLDCHGIGKHPCHDLNCDEHDKDVKTKKKEYKK